MNRSQLVAIADAMCAVNPSFKQGGCISQLQVLAHSWQGTDAELAAHALLVAGDPAAQTPAAINNTPPRQPKLQTGAARDKQPACYICGNTRTACQALHDFEIAHGLPDPHIFETHEEADANTGKVQFDPIQLALAAMPRVNEYEESDERKAAKVRARQAIQDARRKVAWSPKPERPEDQPQKCSGCGGTLSRDEHETHPGCTRQPQPDQQEITT